MHRNKEYGGVVVVLISIYTEKTLQCKYSCYKNCYNHHSDCKR